MAQLVLKISDTQSGRQVRSLLKNELGLSSTCVNRLKRTDKGIRVNGERVFTNAVVTAGDVLTVELSAAERPSEIPPLKMPLDIIFEDEHLLIINKSAPLAVIPSSLAPDEPTLANGLAHMCKVLGSPFVFRPINRLDKDTSGLVLVAKNKLAAYRLSEAMKKGEIHKSYVAVLCGHISAPSGELIDFMRRAPGSKMLRQICRENEADAMMAFTRYKKIVSNDMFSLVIAAPITGRTHQLRLQFAGDGHPLVGDTLYGYPYEHIARQALHAFRLSFPHPITQKRLQFSIPLPKDLSALCYKLFGRDDFSF